MTWQVTQVTMIAVLLGSIRAAVWLTICPPLATRGIPGPVKGLLSVAIALPMAPMLARSLPPTMSLWEVIVSAIMQAVIGGALGFLTYLLFSAVQSAGAFIDLFGGFSIAFTFDPFAYTSNAVFGRFYQLVGTTLLFVTDGHQVILAGFLRSYRALPLNSTMSLEVLKSLLVDGVGQMFLAAIEIAGPLIAVLFLADVALGLLNRVAPALNALNLGFPAKILLTLVIAGSALAVLPGACEALVVRASEAMLALFDGS